MQAQRTREVQSRLLRSRYHAVVCNAQQRFTLFWVAFAGCTIHYTFKPIIQALVENKRILTPASNYADKTCGHDKGSLSCFFKPFANCSTIIEDTAGRTIFQDDFKYWQSTSYTKHGSKIMPPMFGGTSTQYFWLVSQVAAFVTTANARLEATLQKELKSLEFDANRPILGVHVRLGDACSDSQFDEVLQNRAAKVAHPLV